MNLTACASVRSLQVGKDYVVDHKIDLRGKTLTLPENGKLIFKGRGKICNGILVGMHTQIVAEKRLIMENVTIARKGTWNNGRSYPEWFGASNNPNVDSKMAIQKAIDVADTCVLSQDYYMAYDTPTGRGDAASVCAIEIANTTLYGEQGRHIYVNARQSNTERTSVFWVGDNVTIDGVNIEYYKTDYSGWTGIQAGVYRVQGGKVTVENTTLRGAMAAWINIQGKTGRQGFIIRNNFVHDCDCGVIIQGDEHGKDEIYSMQLVMENNTIEKEFVRQSEFISFWGSSKNGGKVYYKDVEIRNNVFRGGWQGGCIAGHPKYNGLLHVVISDNQFYDCGACSFYNADGLIYKRNYVTGSTFVERQVNKVMGSYPNLAFYNCKNCVVDDNSCFGLTVENCKSMKIGKLKQTLGMKVDDPYFQQQPAYVTNFIGIKAKNSTVTIEELTINPFDDDDANTELCRYYVNTIEGSDVKVKKTVSSIPIQISAKRVNMGEKVFRVKGKSKDMYIETIK